MIKCEECGKEFKSAAGLKRHMKVHKEEKVESTEEAETIATEHLEEKKVETKAEVPFHVEKRIRKLRDAIKSCLDAETKYRLECELKNLLAEV